MKRCSKCDSPKPLEEFTKNKSRKDGLNSACRSCHHEYTRRHYEQHKAYYVAKARKRDGLQKEVILKLLAPFKKKPCTECGKCFPAPAMQFDHLDPTKKEFDVANMVGHGYSVAKVLKEVSKCEVVCANCHAIRTEARRHGPVAQLD